MILFLTRLYEPHVGGVEKHIRQLNRELRKGGGHALVLTWKYDIGLKDTELLNGVAVVRIQYPKIKLLGLLVIWVQLFKNIRLLKRSNIVHCHDVFIWYLPFRFLFPNKPVYTTFHGYEGYPISKKAVLIRKVAEKLSWGNICIGDFIKKWYGTKPDYVSYGGVDTRKFRSTKQRKFEFDAVFSSRLDEQTGILTYLKAVKELRKRGIDFKLVVLGDGKFRRKADKVAITKGFVKDPFPYFKNSKFAFVSRYLAILEAMAAKKLVFAVYDNPLKRDYLKMAPFAKYIIIERSPKKLTERVEYFMNHPKEEKKLVEAGYKWARKQTWKKVFDTYLKLWGVSNL